MLEEVVAAGRRRRRKLPGPGLRPCVGAAPGVERRKPNVPNTPEDRLKAVVEEDGSCRVVRPGSFRQS